MTLGFWAILVATFMYLLVAISCFRQRDAIHGCMWLSYCAANICMIAWEFKKLEISKALEKGAVVEREVSAPEDSSDTH